MRRFCCVKGDGSMVSASDGDSFVVRRMATALWCVGWRWLCGALNVDGFMVRRMSTASWCVECRRLCGASDGDGFAVRRMAMLKRPSPAGKANEAEEAVTGVTSK